MNIIEDESALLNELQKTSVSINKCREVLIELLNSKTLPAQLLLEPIELLRSAKPSTFECYQFDEEMPEVSNIEIDWSAKYFDDYKARLESNFSYERYENLIRVKSQLERDGVKGFGIKLSQIKNITKSTVQETITMKQLPSSYLPPENVKDSVSKGNIIYIRSAILALLTNNNVQWSELNNAVIWTLKQCHSLFDAHIEANYAKAINPNTSAWSADYYFEQEVYLNANFSEVRWLHLLEVRKCLAAKNVKGFVRNAAKNVSNQPTTRGASNVRSAQINPQQSTKSADPDKLKVMLMIGGAIAILAALIFAMIG
uniref:Uncharacterized protein n=1 Tax=Aliivibrio wodanis TaxID=80852 RepID=A0A5Q4ZVL5_9GAMM|nr:hypothetical protein AW0309160_03818 [Aliivibrio wodanis]